MAKRSVGVIFGSRSVEHGVSILTAHYVMAALDRTKYDVVPIYITRDGRWMSGRELLDPSVFKDFEAVAPRLKRVALIADPVSPCLALHPEERRFFRKSLLTEIDVAFPVLHGTHGEDGTIQGLLELTDIPYVGPGVLASAVGMDKVLMKSVFRDHSLPVVDFAWYSRAQWKEAPEAVLDDVEKRLRYPVFVKPSSGGSSIGITKARNREELRPGLDLAGQYDRRLLVEVGVENALEINCAVLGYGDPIASACEQPISEESLFSYEEKYLRDMGGRDRLIPAPIAPDLTAEIQQLAIRAFKAIDCRGVARVDFLVDREGSKPYVNEINTIPGALAFRLWKPLGLRFSELLDRLIQIALDAHEDKRQTRYSSEHDTMLLKYLDRVSMSRKFGIEEW